ncbi:MAG: response regulator [Gemmataceae bacterium]|nr:response regulator [Gemmataceae bacterium]
MNATVLVVDDEDSVRRTFHDWLLGSGLDLRVFAVADAEAALRIANDNPIDLAVLDWNLGSGSDGLRLLEDLVVFTPEIVAILVTGFAHQATPLDALRMGVRDYLDKNQNLTRETFLAAVRKQLDRIAPAKRQRELNARVAAFRESVENVLPIVRASAALNDPVPLPDAVRSLFQFLLRGTGAPDGALIVRHVAPDGTETLAAYAPDGRKLPAPATAFARTLAASVIGHDEPCLMNDFASGVEGLELFPFEENRKTVLAARMPVGAGVQVVLEMFDKPAFTEDDRRTAAVAAELGAELLRQGLAQRQTHRLLFDAVESALAASQAVTSALASPAPTEAAMERLKTGLDATANAVVDSATGLELLEAVRRLALRHGPDAVRHCARQIDELRELLDRIVGTAP